MEKFKAFMDWIRDEHDHLAYRYVFGVWWVTRGPWEVLVDVYGTMKVLPGGGYVVRAGGSEELHLADDEEREAFHKYVEQRYTTPDTPTMSEWERQRHDWFMEWP